MDGGFGCRGECGLQGHSGLDSRFEIRERDEKFWQARGNENEPERDGYGDGYESEGCLEVHEAYIEVHREDRFYGLRDAGGCVVAGDGRASGFWAGVFSKLDRRGQRVGRRGQRQSDAEQRADDERADDSHHIDGWNGNLPGFEAGAVPAKGLRKQSS